MEYFEICKVYSFMDYVKGGLQIHCTIAIDFTGLVTFFLHDLVRIILITIVSIL